MLASAHFIATLSDSSQVRKTSLDKEQVMVHVERNGKILFLMWLHCIAMHKKYFSKENFRILNTV